MNMDEDLKMILLTLFGYMFFAVVTILLYAVVKYFRKRRKSSRSIDDSDFELENQRQLSSAFIENEETEFNKTPQQKRLSIHRWENWGDWVKTESSEDTENKSPEKSSKKNSLKKYNPYEWLNIDFIFDESGLQEAYRDIKRERLKRAKEDKEFSKYNGFLEWLKGMIVIDEKIIK